MLSVIAFVIVACVVIYLAALVAGGLLLVLSPIVPIVVFFLKVFHPKP